MSIGRDEIERIARLAHLALDDRKLPELIAQLDEILEHVAVLSRVDTGGVGDASSAPDALDAGLRLRADAGPPISLERSRETFAPAMRDGFFVVPRLATHEQVGEAAS